MNVFRCLDETFTFYSDKRMDWTREVCMENKGTGKA